MSLNQLAREIAAKRIDLPTELELLARWWIQKYKLPSNHSLFTSRTPFDLTVEYYEDYFERNPLERHRNEDGHVQVKNTGDAQFDRWEADIAEGYEPDLMEAFSEGELARIAKMRARVSAAHARMKNGGGSLRSTAESIEQENAQTSSLSPRAGWDQGFGDGT